MLYKQNGVYIVRIKRKWIFDGLTQPNTTRRGMEKENVCEFYTELFGLLDRVVRNNRME